MDPSDDQNNECHICTRPLENPGCFFPCGHSICDQCSGTLLLKSECPFCKTTYDAFIVNHHIYDYKCRNCDQSYSEENRPYILVCGHSACLPCIKTTNTCPYYNDGVTFTCTDQDSVQCTVNYHSLWAFSVKNSIENFKPSKPTCYYLGDETALMRACYKNDFVKVKQILTHYKYDKDYINLESLSECNTALDSFLSGSQFNLEIVKILIENGAEYDFERFAQFIPKFYKSDWENTTPISSHPIKVFFFFLDQFGQQVNDIKSNINVDRIISHFVEFMIHFIKNEWDDECNGLMDQMFMVKNIEQVLIIFSSTLLTVNIF